MELFKVDVTCMIYVYTYIYIYMHVHVVRAGVVWGDFMVNDDVYSQLAQLFKFKRTELWVRDREIFQDHREKRDRLRM